MIQVHIWNFNFRGLQTAMGHASMHVGHEYVSWWPGGDGRDPKLPTSAGRKVPLYSVKHVQGQSFEDDKLLEAEERDSVWDETRNLWIDGLTGQAQAVQRKSPDHTIRLSGLDEAKILAWWRKYNIPQQHWSTLGQNCATTVGRGLMLGGADDYALGAAGWWHSWNTVWQPNDVLRYAREVHRGLAARHGRHRAMNLIRRYCTSPLGFTSVTMKMDESGLAEAIYRELGGNTPEVTSVFQELNERRNTDADDVAEIYVKLLRTRKGPPLAAVAKDAKLKSLLIKVLDEGWTTDGEKQCIAFLKSLT